MAFVQIIDFTTEDIASVQALDAEWERATEGKRTARRLIIAKDHNSPNRYLEIVFFDSYESAMENSELAETQAIAEKYRAATTSVSFIDLDVVSDKQG